MQQTDPYAQTAERPDPYASTAEGTPITPATLRQRAQGLVQKARTNLETNTQDLTPTGGIVHDDLVAPVVRQFNRAGKGIVGGLLDFAQNVVDPAEEVQKRNAAEAQTAFDKSIFNPDSKATGADIAEQFGNAIPVLPGAGSQVRQDLTSGHPVGDILGDVAQIAVMHGTAKTAPKPGVTTPASVKGFVENQRRQIRDKFGGGEEFTEAKVKDFGKDAQRVREKNQAETEKTEREKGIVDEQNEAAGRQHVKKTVKQLKQDAAKLREASEARARVKAANEQAATEHKGEVEKAFQEREGAEHVAGLREQAETEATQEAEKLKNKTATTKATAKAKNDTLWKDLREKIGSDPIDATGKLQEEVESVKKGLTKDESEQLDATLRSQMSPEEAAEDAQLAEAYNNLSPEFKGHVDKMTGTLDQLGGIDQTGAEPMTFPKLQGIYTELGLKLSRGGLAGNVYYGLVKLRESIGDMMQTVADQKGAGADLKAARKSHQEFAEAFYKDRSKPLSAADKLLRDSNPEAYAADEDKKQVAKMAKHDPSIAEDYKRVEAAREKARSLPHPEQLRKGLTQPPDRPAQKALPELPTPRPLPEKPPQKPYGEPTATTPQVEPTDLTKERRDVLQKNLKKYGATGQWVWRLIAGSTLKAASHATGMGAGGEFASDLLIGQGALKLVTNMLRHDRALDWLARPTPEDIQIINTLPPEDAAKMRTAMTGLAVEDAKRGGTTKVSPDVARFLGQANLALITAAVTSGQPQTAGEAKKRVAEARK